MSMRPPSTPRASVSSIPAPGSTPSSLPTPRRKSGISLTQRPPALHALGSSQLDSLREAVRRNDPHRYDSPVGDGPSTGGADSPSPAESLGASTPGQARRGPVRKPSSINVRPGQLSASLSRPTTPSNGSSTPRTPSHPPRSRTPVAFGSSVSGRPSSRLAMSRGPSARGLEVGDAVKFEVGGLAMEGTIRYMGGVDGKDGEWGGVELDAEWEGRGKNDGSVKGTQYFACPPLCGLFLPLAKITAKPKAATRPPATPIANKLTVGSRAHKLASATASQLANNRRVSSMGAPLSPSKATATPRRAASPEKPSSASSQTTPRPRARASIGGPTFGIPTPRKSMGPGTPRQSLGASIKRPPSSLRQNTLPDVPPIPNSFSLARSATPSSAAGRATPSTPGGTHTRRMSMATESSLSQSRPTTPSVRSQSRQSFASSISRQSHRSLVDDDAHDELKRAAEEAKEREEEVRRLLEGSERLGREMEDLLAERERRLKEAEERVELLEQERNREKERELARMAGVGDEEKEQDARRVLELESRVEELVKAEAATKTATERLAREWETKFAAKEGENESLRERMAAAAKDAEEERLDLNQQLDQLRGAGQALCETYEERIADIELSRLESVELAETLQEQLNALGGGASGAGVGAEPTSPHSPTSRLSTSHNSRTSAADVINAESAQAELEHMQGKIGALEELLEETKMHLEAEIADSKRRRTKHGETEQMLKQEIKTLRETIARHTKAEARTTARIEELEDALVESQTTLEEERSELEGLRNDASGSASSGLADEIKRANKQIATLKTERQTALREAEDARRDSAKTAELVQQLQDDLRAAEKELEQLQVSHPGLQSRNGSFATDRSRTPPQYPTQDTTPSSLQPSPSHKRDSIVSTSSRRSLGKDEATVTKDQIVGLKIIIQGLEEENAEMSERNKQLLNESQELKNAQRSLEVTVENLMAEMSKDGKAGPSSPTVERRESENLTEAPLRREIDDLKAKLQEIEKKSDREIKALNQEVSELESLVESKIYREDELETELEKYKSLARTKVSSESSSASVLSKSRTNGTTTSRDEDEGGECEMCGQMGHDLDDCPIFAGSAPSPTKSGRNHSPTPSGHSRTASGAEREFCDDCEEYGHSLENCTLSSDVF